MNLEKKSGAEAEAAARFERAIRRALSTPATAPLSGVKARKKKRKAKKKKRPADAATIDGDVLTG